ncbi:MAG: OadG family protein [Clostridia bacterium]|nr:OadG family protein [Clostridia bacterium]
MFDSIDISSSIINFESFELGQLGSAFLYGGSVLLIGMATVFAVLCLLWLCLAIFKLCFHTIPERKAKKKKVAPVVQVAPKVVEVKKPDDGEIIAVIAAAIAMAESEDSGMKFRVVSFKRI